MTPQCERHLCSEISLFANRLKHSLKDIFVGIVNQNDHQHSRLKIPCRDAFLLFYRRAKNVYKASERVAEPIPGGIHNLAVFKCSPALVVLRVSRQTGLFEPVLPDQLLKVEGLDTFIVKEPSPLEPWLD
jgi:hypothetical protein